MSSRPYAEHLTDYALAGWPCVLPVPPETKTPPPVGFTGAEGRDTDVPTLVDLAGRFPTYSIALRLPDGVIGIDVDQYEKAGVQKHGAETLAAYAAAWGPLPPTWSSTARAADGPSRIYLFRVPPGRYATRLATDQTGDVEVIQRHHRYAVVWPSAHPAAGSIYRWYDPAGNLAERVPSPAELAELPPAWVAGLAEGAASAAAASAPRGEGQQLLDQLLEDWRPECADVTSARYTALEQLGRADAGSRHDTMTERTHHLIQLGAAGHTGAAAALLELRTLWEQITVGEDRGEEFDRALLTSARKAVTVVGPVQVPNDPCLLTIGGVALPVPSPRVDPGVADPELQVVELPRWGSIRQILGAHAFDPNAGHDQHLAEAVLQRTYPALRFAYDSRGWLLRTPERWELHGRLSAWAIAQLAPLMPVGDPTAEKGSDQKARSERRTRMLSTAGAKAVAAKIDDLVAGGMHPASVALADLDADPEVLWAGGLPWSLRDTATTGAPAPAPIDPASPHLSTAAVAPQPVPTPLWDAFTAAVWPDEHLRRWALRVLSIAFTGYADRALPILLGETGRGKTQVVALLMSVLGGYAHAANPKLLSASANAHDSIVFSLKGRRLSFVDEAPREARSGQERLKQLTGGGELTANAMRQDPITFRPTHTLVLTANDEPNLTDPAVRARTRLIPCVGDPEAVAVARAAIGHVSGPAWRAEAPGVLAAMMGQAGAWLLDPSSAAMTAAPEEIRYLVEAIGAEQDPVHQWLTEEVEPYELGTSSRELYQAFRASCHRSGIRPDQVPTEVKWGREVTRRGYPSVHTKVGKIRRLRVRIGGDGLGQVPGMLPGEARPSVDQFLDQSTPDRSSNWSEKVTGSRIGDGLVTGSKTNPSPENVQVNPSESVAGDGLTGKSVGYARKEESDDLDIDANLETPSTRHREPSAPSPKPPAKSKRTTAATERAAERRAAARAAAIAEASGPQVPLPALQPRDGDPVAGDLEQLDALLATITAAPAGELTVDVEHTGYPVGHRHYALRTVQLGSEHFTVVLDPADPAQADVVRRHVAAAPILHAHSATADLVPLEFAGLLEHGLEEAWSRMHDTVIPAKLADPASTGSDPALKKLAAAMLREHAVSPAADAARAALFKAGKWLTEVKVTHEPERSGWAQVASDCTTMIRYAAADVLDDAAIASRLPAVPPRILARERLAQRMTARVAAAGLRIDADHTLTLHAQQTEALDHAAQQLAAFGIENPGSDAQVAAAVEAHGVHLPRTKTGKASVAHAAVAPYANAEGPLGDLVKARLAYQEAENRLGLFLEPYLQLTAHGDGRARPTIYTLSADTGRMSCVRPNLQQVPREGGFRACITADPGELLISADFAGVELRVAAALSGDANLRAILDDPERDLHMEIARLAFGPGATKAQRYAVKRGVFGRIYGGGVAAIAAGVGVSLTTAQAIIDALDALLPGLAEWSRRVREAVKAGHTTFPTYAGRVVHLDPDLPHKAPNYLIQGTARELLIDALERWAETPWGNAVLLPVHDELVVRVPEADAEQATRTLVECMTAELVGIPIVAEPSAPTFAWADSA